VGLSNLHSILSSHNQSLFLQHPSGQAAGSSKASNKMSSFTAIPVLDFSLSRDESTKPAFLDELRRTLLGIGFLYIKNTGIDEDLVEEVIRLGKAFFDLPESEKMRVDMTNCRCDYFVSTNISSRLVLWHFCESLGEMCPTTVTTSGSYSVWGNKKQHPTS